MIEKILSYFIPIKIHTVKSEVSKAIEVTWTNGELVMDSENTNYSYGSLQRILRLGLKTIGFKKIVAMNHILVLGVAGGSVIKTLVDEIKFEGKITGVEIDPNIIKIANQYFNLDEIKQLDIIIDDAFEFVLKTKEKYDLIIIDVFQDTTMPNFLYETFFTDQVCFLLRSKGVVLFNTMLLNEKQNARNLKYITEFNNVDYNVKSIPRVERHNELIVIEKIH
ncbi:spermidine synthase [Flavobacterium degerlachei]|jgi:spermidine synthase|uniref:Spermine/spermidine synthase n=1 Tax=Flavobacterium degerlachei TaxID=229203 RepID=A0A1H3F1F9_9FLAO|nr:fused MFS/spermidine synthase [Flavobacterium degerlachei]SDX84832.1 Spermine/spermidine synthase [Flavobacterium degerlachei]